MQPSHVVRHVVLAIAAVGLTYLVGSTVAAQPGAPGPKDQPLLTPVAKNAPRPRAAAVGTPVVPCGDVDGCPDLYVSAPALVDWDAVTRSFSPNSCGVLEGYAQGGSNLLLRFTFNTPNVGPGDLVVGSVHDHEDWFSFDNCHGHSHFREYADYRLWTVEGYEAWIALRQANPDAIPSNLLAANPAIRAQLITGRKFGFCVIDYRRVTSTARLNPLYLNCELNQGISTGWADEYTKTTDGQWFDVTDVPSGTYVVEAEVNAERFFTETNYQNNASALTVNFAPITRPSTRTPTPTPTVNPAFTPTQIPTATVALPGGRGLAIKGGQPTLNWVDGAVESGYLVYRWSPTSAGFVPASGAPLPFNATGTIDTTPLTDYVYCYDVIPLGPNLTVLGLSDLMCIFPNTATGPTAPGQFSVRLNQTNVANLRWTPPVNASGTPVANLTGYTLLAITLDGQQPRLVPLAAGFTSTMDATNGVMTCYILQAMNGTTVLGSTDALCGVPGIAGVASANRPRTVQQVVEQTGAVLRGGLNPR